METQTQCSSTNFSIGTERFRWRRSVIRAFRIQKNSPLYPAAHTGHEQARDCGLVANCCATAYTQEQVALFYLTVGAINLLFRGQLKADPIIYSHAQQSVWDGIVDQE